MSAAPIRDPLGNSQIAKWDNSHLRDSYMLYPNEGEYKKPPRLQKSDRPNLINYVSNPNFILLTILLHNDTHNVTA